MEIPENRFSAALLLFYSHVHHLVHTIVFDNSAGLIQPHQIIIIIVPEQLAGAYPVAFSSTFRLKFSGQRPLIITETDLPVGRNGVVNRLYLRVDLLIQRLDAA